MRVLCKRGAALLLAATLAAASATLPARAQAEAPLRLRIVGGLAGVHQFIRHEEPFWTRTLPALTGGKASAEIVPFDRAGIQGQEMLRLMQIGVVPFGTAILALSSVQDPELGAVDLAGLNPDMQTMRRNTAAFRPFLQRTLHDRYGIELLALYVYPAQVVFCDRPLKGLADLAGRRVRTSSPSQADFVGALGAVAVPTGFADIMPSMRSGRVECAITGTMSGNTIGLHTVTTHIHAMAINWGVAMFGANTAAWDTLPAELKALLKRELPKLEQAVWAESDHETGEGIACNVGAPACVSGQAGKMTAVRPSPQDERLRRGVFVSTVLPRWIQRCGPHCASLWNDTVGRAAGIEAPR